jgi:hypothetical protein
VSDLRKTAKQALEALELEATSPPLETTAAAMEAIRAALAQPEPFNPDWDRVTALEESLREHMAEIHRLKALAQPAKLVVGSDDLPTLTKWTPQRKPLTDEQIAEICMDCSLVTPSDIYFARAIEKAHGIGGEV